MKDDRFERAFAPAFKRSVYVAGPYKIGDRDENTRRAVAVGVWFADRGCAVFIPHLFHHANKDWPRSEDYWLAQDLYWLAHCSATVRLPGSSNGSDIETRESEIAGRALVFLAEQDVQDILAGKDPQNPELLRLVE